MSLGLTALLAGQAFATSGGIVALEFLEKRMSGAQAMTPLTDEAFGDSVSLFDGSTRFEVFDIDLPGNNELPVRLGRTWKPHVVHTYLTSRGFSTDTVPLGGFGQWDISVPHISGTFDSWYGWHDRSHKRRCSTAQTPQTIDGINPKDILSGIQLYIPGEGNVDLYWIGSGGPDDGDAYVRPDDGATYYWGTSTQYRARCIALPGGTEGFEIVDPRGNVYRMDTLATRDGGIVENVGVSGASTVAGRVVHYLLASRVSDRYGNWVDYQYAGNGELSGISSSDGRSITTTRQNGQIASATAGTRTWNFSYGSEFKVTNPDQTQWKYQVSGSNVSSIQDPVQDDPNHCHYPIINGSVGNYVLTAKAPSGLKGEFTFAPAVHRVSGTPSQWFCVRELTWVSPSEYVVRASIATPDFFTNLALARKVLSGPGMEAKEWSYMYGHPETGHTYFESAWCSTDNCDPDKPVIVWQPDGTKKVYQFGALWGFNTGRLLAEYTLDANDRIQKSIVYEHVSEAEIGAQPFAAMHGLGGSSDDLGTYRNRPVKKTTISIGENVAGHPEWTPAPPPPTPPCTPETCGPPTLPPENPCPPGQIACSDPTSLPPGTMSAGAAPDRFVNEVLSFDAHARPTRVRREGNAQRTDTLEYHDNLQKWIVGQLHRSTNVNTGIVESRTDYDANARPEKIYSFGRLVQTRGYWSDGNLRYLSDGRDGIGGAETTVELWDWKRGIPQWIRFPAARPGDSATTRQASVDGDGDVRWTIDELGASTEYDYDAMGRVKTIRYPLEQAPAPATGLAKKWDDTTITLSALAAAEYEVPAGSWKQTVSTGGARKETYFDAMLRPVLEQSYDAADKPGTLSQVVRRYDTGNRLVFQSHPQRNTDLEVTSAGILGTATDYDALGRPTAVTLQGGWEGNFTTTTEYLPGLKTRTVSPRHQASGTSTETGYRAYDQPTLDTPTTILMPADKQVHIFRNTFGNVTALHHRNASGTTDIGKHFFYDEHQRLCRTIEPELGGGVTAQGYDAAGNVDWLASGLPQGGIALTATGCIEKATVAGHGDWSKRLSGRTYDNRNRLHTLGFHDTRGDQTWSYLADGKVSRITTTNVPGVAAADNAYAYFRRGQLKTEVLMVPAWYTYSFERDYSAGGHPHSITYPGSVNPALPPRTLWLNPNALGQSTELRDSGDVTPYADDIRWHANGALASFTYGNGVAYEMTQNDRQLPLHVKYVGTQHYEYWYDGNGNIRNIHNHTQIDHNAPGFHSRGMTYDDLDRLTEVSSGSFHPTDTTHAFTYDAADNLSTWTGGGRDDRYCYSSNRLSSIRTSSTSCSNGAMRMTFGYDPGGNIANRNERKFEFDAGNRLREVYTGPDSDRTLVERYRYDGHGRRIAATHFGPDAPGTILSYYGLDGQLLYQNNQRSGQAKQIHHVYLGGSLVAQREMAGGATTVKYQHTDALGSPVAVTDAAGQVIERVRYEPYGRQLQATTNTGNERPGYTGHVGDRGTGMTYAQQRYYDPEFGVFLSLDPVTAHSNPVVQFNRYRYGNGNPYRFADPDGRSGLDWGARYQANLDLHDGDHQAANDSIARGTAMGLATAAIVASAAIPDPSDLLIGAAVGRFALGLRAHQGAAQARRYIEATYANMQRSSSSGQRTTQFDGHGGGAQARALFEKLTGGNSGPRDGGRLGSLRDGSRVQISTRTATDGSTVTSVRVSMRRTDSRIVDNYKVRFREKAE